MRADVVGRVALEASVVQLDHAAIPVVIHAAALEILLPTFVVARVELALEGGVRPGRGCDVRVFCHGIRGGVANLHGKSLAQSGYLSRGSGKDGKRVQRDVSIGYAVVDGQQIGEGNPVDGDDLLGIHHRGDVH